MKSDILVKAYPDYDNPEASDIFHATITFLIEEGYIRCADRVYSGYVSVILTSKGFAVLQAPAPDVLGIEHKNTVGAELKNLLRSGSDELIRTAINKMVLWVSKLPLTM
ncbi:MAG: hypothetical protein EHM38_09955 [Geobacteraceae bacterium]|nr:MAG: hypothetical protein EHM38_09955 [Geobacteraceae bacterium]